MNPNLANVARVIQADMLPTAPGIGGFVNAIAMRDINTNRGFARAGVDDVRIRFRDRQRADRSGVEVAVGDIAPVLPGVVRLPDATRAGAEVEGADIAGVAGHSDDAPAAEGSDTAPASDVVEREVHGLWAFLCGGW